MIFRAATHEDLPEMKQLYVDTIQEVCKKEYNVEERAQWSSSANKTQRWLDLINDQVVLIIEIGNQIAGFASLQDGNYIDFFYVHKDFQRQGIAQALLDKLIEIARKNSSSYISSDISLTAKGFFEKNGFQVIMKQSNVREKVVLVNFKMRKEL